MKNNIDKIITIFIIGLLLFLSCPIMTNTVNAAELGNNKLPIRYYYNQLSEYAKIIYDGMEENIQELKKSNFCINYYTKFNELLNQQGGKDKLAFDFQSAVDAFFYDHQELFYIDYTKINLQISWYSSSKSTIYFIKMIPVGGNCWLDQFESEEEINRAIAKVEKAREEIIKTTVGDNPFNKILKVHNILTGMLEYDITLMKPNIRNIYGAFIENEVVCEGYARAFKYILDSMNIECILVGGYATTPDNVTELHMWNYVKLKGNWYGIDLTWDDPIWINGNDAITVGPVDTYFLKGANVFKNSHKPTGIISNYGMKYSIPKLCENDYIEDGLPFIDILNNMWYYNAVKFNYENGMIKGTSDIIFDPNGDLTRGMLVTILWRMEGNPKATSNQFTDVVTSQYYYNAVNWAASKKIISGYGNGKFGPNDKITREQLAVILRNYALYKEKNVSARTDLNKFIDNKNISSYAKDAVSWAVANKVISGKAEGTKVDPHGKATRAETAAMLYNYCMNIK